MLCCCADYRRYLDRLDHLAVVHRPDVRVVGAGPEPHHHLEHVRHSRRQVGHVVRVGLRRLGRGPRDHHCSVLHLTRAARIVPRAHLGKVEEGVVADNVLGRGGPGEVDGARAGPEVRQFVRLRKRLDCHRIGPAGLVKPAGRRLGRDKNCVNLRRDEICQSRHLSLPGSCPAAVCPHHLEIAGFSLPLNVALAAPVDLVPDAVRVDPLGRQPRHQGRRRRDDVDRQISWGTGRALPRADPGHELV